MSYPKLPEGANPPCANDEVSGKRLENGEVVDYWFGEPGSQSSHLVRDTYRVAAKICLSVCAVDHPEAFEACAKYQSKHKPLYGVYGGVIPPRH